MTMAGGAQQNVEAYLGRLRQLLRGMNAEDAREIIEELRSHLMDRVAASGEATDTGVDAALAALGRPEELANEYLTHNLLARAEASRSPVRILESLFRWASLSVAGFFVLVGSMMGYFLGTVLPAEGRDVLGWWIVPIGLLAGCAVLMLTTRFALWCARQYRRSHLLPRS